MRGPGHDRAKVDGKPKAAEPKAHIPSKVERIKGWIFVCYSRGYLGLCLCLSNGPVQVVLTQEEPTFEPVVDL